MFSVEPKRPVTHSNYICDKQFHCDYLRELQQEERNERVYGVALVNGRLSELWFVSSLQTVLLKSFETTTMNHHSRGGSSSGRIGRLRENKTARNVSYISEQFDKYYLDDSQNSPNIVALIVGGCAEMRQKIQEELHPALENVFVGSYAWEGVGNVAATRLFESLRENDILKHDLERERLLLEPLWKIMQTNPELLDYGFESIAEKNYKTIYYDATCEKQIVARSAKLVPLHVCKDLQPYGSCVAIRF